MSLHFCPVPLRNYVRGLALTALATIPLGLRAQAPVIESLTMIDANYAYGVNNAAQVVGMTITAGQVRAYLYDGGTMTNITPAGAGATYAYGINNSGQVVGYATLSGTPTAFIYSQGISTTLGSDLNGISFGRAINDAGTIVGDHSSGGANVFTRTSAGTVANFISGGTGLAINNLGIVAGTVPDSQFINTHASIWDGATATDLGTLGGTISTSYGINDAGLVVGSSYITGSTNTHAFAYSGHTMTDLGTLGGATSVARAVNNLGQIVGNSAGTSFGGNHAFIYQDGTMYDLSAAAQAAGLVSSGTITAATVGFTSLDIAYDISDTGYIVGTGTYYTGNWVGSQRSFLIKLQSAAPVPEPATTALLAGAGVLLAGLALRRRRTT